MQGGDWGKPIKKNTTSTKEQAAPPKETANTNASLAAKPQMSTKSEPYVQKTVLEPIPIVARAREGLYLVDDQANGYRADTSSIICEESTISMFNSDGDILAFANPYKVGSFVFSEANGLAYDLPNVLALNFSPSGKYLVAIDKRENKHFLTIFESKTLEKVTEFETLRYKKETWPQLKFVDNDEVAFRTLRPGVIEALDPSNKFKVVKTLETKPFDFFNVSKKREGLIIVTVNLEHSAGYEKNEGRIDIFDYDNLGSKPTVTKIIDKAHEVNLFFSPAGKHLLIWAQTFTDKTGQSYYGEHMLLYLDMNKKALRRVPTYKGPIHDVAWNPNGQEFIAISGFMPAGSVLFTSECVPKFEFGQHHRNTIRWSPFSRYILVGGFGNLSGDMDIWEASTKQKIATFKSNSAVSCLWAPDGKRILTGVLNPRLRVDNAYKVFKYTGELLNSVDYSDTELYEVLWKPGKYTDRPTTPVKKEEKKEEETQKFRPKGASGGSFAAQLKAQKETRNAATGRVLDPNETFGNEANLEVEKEEPKKKKRIRKKKAKGDEENKDDDDGEDDK